VIHVYIFLHNEVSLENFSLSLLLHRCDQKKISISFVVSFLNQMLRLFVLILSSLVIKNVKKKKIQLKVFQAILLVNYS